MSLEILLFIGIGKVYVQDFARWFIRILQDSARKLKDSVIVYPYFFHKFAACYLWYGFNLLFTYKYIVLWQQL